MEKTEPKVSDEYSELHHYTNIYGLKGIIDSNSLWATHCEFTNDKLEIHQSRNYLRDALSNYAAEIAREIKKQEVKASEAPMDELIRIAKHDLPTMVDSLYSTTLDVTPPFISSFCAPSGEFESVNGKLSMWRAYSKNNRCGYCLVFDSQKFEKLMQEEEIKKYKYYMLHLNDISYPKGDIEIEAVFLGKLKLAIQGLLNDIGVSKFSKTLKIDELFQEFSLFTTKYKNQGFEEECEVRLVASPHSKIGSPSENINGRKIFFRENEGLMIPTTNVFGVDVSPLPISKIIIGPNNDPEQYIKSIATYLRHQRLNIEVVQSEIPLRSI